MCLTTGRSGTNLLEKLMELCVDTTSLHEPEPYFSDHVKAVRKDPDFATTFVEEEKLPAIQAFDTQNYVETSHIFGKGFFEAFIKLNIPFQLIILNRSPREVAKSMWRIGAIPGRTEKGLISMYHPEEEGVMKLPNWKRLSNYQLCYWYVLEVERRKALYGRICKEHNVKTIETSIDQLKNWHEFKGFVQVLGMSLKPDAKDEHAHITAKKVNKKRKYFMKIPLQPLSWQEKKVWRLLGSDANTLKGQVRMRYGALS